MVIFDQEKAAFIDPKAQRSAALIKCYSIELQPDFSFVGHASPRIYHIISCGLSPFLRLKLLAR